MPELPEAVGGQQPGVARGRETRVLARAPRYEKLGAHTRAEAVEKACGLGLLAPSTIAWRVRAARFPPVAAHQP